MKRIILLLILSVLTVVAQNRNLLLVVLDDIGPENIWVGQGSQSARIAPTPNIKSLADKGVIFSNYRTSFLCSPSRASMLTGRYEFRHGISSMGTGTDFKIGEFTYADDLNSKGYSTALIGKWGMFTEEDTLDAPRTFGGFSHFSGYYPINSPTPVSYYSFQKSVNGSQPFNVEKYLTTDQVDDAVAWITTREEPWFCQLSFNAPHSQSSAPNYPRPPDELSPVLKDQGLPTDQAWAYTAMIEAVDTELGRLFSLIDLTDTLVIVKGDNGSPFPQPPYALTEGKNTRFLNAVRSPLIIAGAGIVNPGRISRDLIESVDIYPTIMRHLGNWDVGSPNTIDGVDMSWVLRAEKSISKKYTYWQRGGFSVNLASKRYRLEDYFSSGATDRFYNIETDPRETTNLLSGDLSGEALNVYNEMRHALATSYTTKLVEPSVSINYAQPSTVTGNITIKRGSIAVVRPERNPSTITTPIVDGATSYTLWKKDGDFSTWYDTGLTPVITSVVTFTDPFAFGRPSYQITNNAH